MQYSTFDLVEITGVQRERLREWLTKGFIKASIQSANGIGTKNIFSDLDLLRIDLFMYILEVFHIKREYVSLMLDLWIQELKKSYSSITKNITIEEWAIKKGVIIYTFEDTVKCRISESKNFNIKNKNSTLIINLENIMHHLAKGTL